MRVVFSVAGLLIAALCVLLLVRSQLKAMGSGVAQPAASLVAPQPGGTALPSTPANLPRQVQQDVGRSLEQGMAARASAVAP